MYVTYNYICIEEGRVWMKDKTRSYIEIWDLLDDIQSLINILARKIQFQYDLTPQELRVLIELDRTSVMNISELSKAINRDFGNVSRTCSMLARKGLLNRYRCKDDQRITLVRLTAKGKEKLNIFYDYNMTLMQSKKLENNIKKYQIMVTGMKMFRSFVMERMEALDD